MYNERLYKVVSEVAGVLAAVAATRSTMVLTRTGCTYDWKRYLSALEANLNRYLDDGHFQ